MDPEPEKAVLVAVEMNRRDHPWSLEDSLSELEYLANTAGAQVVGNVTQRANRLGSTYVGAGKVDEIREMMEDEKADVVIFDPDVDWVVNTEDFASKGKNTPLAGAMLKGKVMATIYSGQLVHSELTAQSSTEHAPNV